MDPAPTPTPMAVQLTLLALSAELASDFGDLVGPPLDVVFGLGLVLCHAPNGVAKVLLMS